MTASRPLSLKTGIRNDVLSAEIRSAIGIVIASRSGLLAATVAIIQQMTVRGEESLRLKAAGVMQRLKELREEVNFPATFGK